MFLLRVWVVHPYRYESLNGSGKVCDSIPLVVALKNILVTPKDKDQIQQKYGIMLCKAVWASVHFASLI